MAYSPLRSDEESLRKILSQVLTEDQHEVIEAASGEQALALFKKEPFPLVITDIVMDGMSGIELLQEIKQHGPETQVIIMTSHASLDTAINAIRAGAYDYLIKPFEDIELISSVSHRAIENIRLVGENKRLLHELTQKNEELTRANKVLKELSIRDGLTGLFNHRYFQEALALEILRSRRYERAFSVIFLDVDFFKQYNDTNGHPDGDKLLITLAQLLRDRLRRSDIVARYGGEEFVLLLPETAKENALQVAENIRQKVADYPFAGWQTQPFGRVTISLGVAAFPDEGEDGSTLIERADAALYRAKEAGRNAVR